MIFSKAGLFCQPLENPKGKIVKLIKKIDFLYSDQDFLEIEFNFMKKVEKEVKETEKKDNSNYLSAYPLFTKETFQNKYQSFVRFKRKFVLNV